MVFEAYFTNLMKSNDESRLRVWHNARMAVVRMSLDASQFNGKKTPRTTTPTYSANAFSPRTTSLTRATKKAYDFGSLLKKVGIVVLLFASIWFGARAVRAIFAGNSLGGTQSLIPVLNPKLLKDESGRTNVMLVGIDTRETGTVELNTDTIILGSYDEKTNRLAMVSFPRDLAVTSPDTGNVGRINAIYALGERKKKGTGLTSLQKVVEELSGQKIQYYGMVDLKGFTDAIDVIGGIDIYLDADLSGLYPTDKLNYIKVSFKKGWNKFDGKTALQYSRMRKDVKPVSEAGDFARARRQQKVIQAVIDKVSKSETLLDAKKVWNLLTVLQKNVKTSKFTIEDVQAGIGLIKEKGKPASYTYVMDFYAGNELGKLIDVISTNPYLIGPVKGQGKWSDVQSFIKEYIAEPTLPTMTKRIVVYDGGNGDFASRYKNLLNRFYFVDFVKGGTYIIPSKTTVYAVGGKSYDIASAYLAKLVNGTAEPVPSDFPMSVDKNTAIVVIL
jgi:LCP family protein required for cell wall assembly